MASEDRKWIDVRIGMTADEAVGFLEKLAGDPELRARLEKDPHGTLREYHIEFAPGQVPTKVQLPDEETIRSYARSLRSTRSLVDDWPVAHGFCVLWVAHGNGAVPPPPPPPDAA